MLCLFLRLLALFPRLFTSFLCRICLKTPVWLLILVTLSTIISRLPSFLPERYSTRNCNSSLRLSPSGIKYMKYCRAWFLPSYALQAADSHAQRRVSILEAQPLPSSEYLPTCSSPSQDHAQTFVFLGKPTIRVLCSCNQHKISWPSSLV